MRIFLRHLKLATAGLVLLALGTHGPLALASAQPRGPTASPLVVIVSAQSSIRDLPMALLERIFLGEVSEHQGTRFLPLNYAADSALRRAFDEVLLGFTGDAAGRYWID